MYVKRRGPRPPWARPLGQALRAVPKESPISKYQPPQICARLYYKFQLIGNPL